MSIRKKKLINPGLQLRLVAIFLCAAALAVQAEAILITYMLTRLAERMPTDGSLLLAALPEFVRTNLLLTFAVLAPLTLVFGIVATYRIAGPLYRFEQFLRNVREGKQIEPCSLRKGDELQEICDLLNDVTRPLRSRSTLASFQLRAGDLDVITPALPAPGSEDSKTSGAAEAGDGRTPRAATG
jgi:hypothetical protein